MNPPNGTSAALLQSKTFDLFAGTDDRDAQWLESIVGIDNARARIQEVAAAQPGEYFIFFTDTGTILERVNTTQLSKEQGRDVA